ncbi:MAG: 8-amino-7-oxononanoate synthase [Gammaproteobacteria bacterium]
MSGNHADRVSGLEADLARRSEAGLLRRQQAVSSRSGVVIRRNNEGLVNFCSNDYLGLASHPSLIRAWSQAAQRYGIGSGASPLICGRYDIHDELERALARFTGRERALLFTSGYQANLGAITALAHGRRDRIIMDRLCHASLIDGARQSRAQMRRFPHGDSNGLERMLKGNNSDFALVVSESVFSMDGDMAPLKTYARLCNQYGALLFVDDAHGFGVLGKDGRGGLEHSGLTAKEAPLMMATFGKALGVSGAFVAGDNVLVEALIQYARPYIYSTAMPPAVAATVLAALELLREEAWRRRHLQALIQRYRAGAGRRGLPVMDSSTPIQPLLIGSSGRALEVSEQLQQRGYFVAAIRPPTVPQNSARLRITLTAEHSEEQVDGLLSALEEAVHL